MLSRLRYSENYYFSLELETANADAVEKASMLLLNQIIHKPAAPFRFILNLITLIKFMTNEVSGGGFVHKAHGIILKKVTPDTSVTA